ncbi:helix-turn-helix transcriptional regulator [Vibrio rhizosphaerae]|uniref:Helix-turn-helix transcriptional regulator n=1 Tax=Vibrio rhizosphaerae TaxID=398736 RepID=A0ABU4J1J0_9VIBR|nr:helix-turn-helix transcriptional regulator [Vibrio rhizosphaerae]MDW6094458.1 helix-turn-helix transcriptional regulator [Vibrio rhizosphaerae]
MKFCDEALGPPIIAYAHNYSHGDVEAPHIHQCAQFLHALNGVIRVDTQAGAWVVTANKGLWIPAGVSHSLRITGDVRVRTLFVDPMARADLPNTCVLSTVSPLLTCLIVEAVALPDVRMAGTREERIFELILDELRRLNPIDFYLPHPSSEALITLCRNLSERLSHPWTASDAAKSLGQSERTVSRRFQQELGLTFTEWLRQKRLLHALELLASGCSVLDTALAIGYDSPSAFSAMFKSRTGLSPSEYCPPILPLARE